MTTDYKILTSLNSKDLSFAVQRHLDHGWELHGSISVSENPHIGLIQPVIRSSMPDADVHLVIPPKEDT